MQKRVRTIRPTLPRRRKHRRQPITPAACERLPSIENPRQLNGHASVRAAAAPPHAADGDPSPSRERASTHSASPDCGVYPTESSPGTQLQSKSTSIRTRTRLRTRREHTARCTTRRATHRRLACAKGRQLWTTTADTAAVIGVEQHTPDQTRLETCARRGEKYFIC